MGSRLVWPAQDAEALAGGCIGEPTVQHHHRERRRIGISNDKGGGKLHCIGGSQSVPRQQGKRSCPDCRNVHDLMRVAGNAFRPAQYRHAIIAIQGSLACTPLNRRSKLKASQRPKNNFRILL